MIRGERVALPSSRLHELFELQVDRTPNAAAIRCDGAELSYVDVEKRANRLAWQLIDMGVTRGEVVVICLPPSSELIIALLAVLKAGAAYLPLEPTAPRHRVASILATANIVAAITTASAAELFTTVSVPMVCVDPHARPVGLARDERPRRVGSARDLAYVIYTSGSTGLPKGVEVEHRGVVNYVLWANKAYRLERGRGCPLHSALSVDLAVTSVFCPLLAGRSVHVLRVGDIVDAVVEMVRLGGYSLVKLTPSHVDVLDFLLGTEEARRLTRRLVIGGEQLYGEALRLWRREMPETRIVNEYGPTEATVGCCAWDVAAGELSDGPVPIGRPIANTAFHVGRLDDLHTPCRPGERGELLIGGVGVARGYRADAELTARRFVEYDIDVAERRLFRTGDLVSVRHDGLLEFHGRLDNQLKVRGHRVEPGEIEAALRLHPRVRAAVVMTSTAGGEPRLTAYLVGTSDDGPPPERVELRTFLVDRLPPHMIPEVFYWHEVLPLNTSGKVDRSAVVNAEGRVRVT